MKLHLSAFNSTLYPLVPPIQVPQPICPFEPKILAYGSVQNASGDKYAGSYVGAGTGKAALSGSRKGNAINLGIRWAKDVNGDRKALMTVKKVGANGMTLTTVDIDPKSGKNVVTTRIKLSRT